MVIISNFNFSNDSANCFDHEIVTIDFKND